ncbi:MAG: 5'-nucleotidase C-terminal domain-containing protein [Huintestinicola sp.]|uniref:5'-nucleotidase C-terminal domain-containing protein n=1 Tax=Huintestinicola sp. TaxID=2981661 RepID=UPI003F11634D
MRMEKTVSLIFAAAAGAAIMSGCGQAAALPQGAAENEILTLDPVDGSKEMVTIHFEYGLDIAHEIESGIEEQFPDVDVVMIHDGASDSLSLLEGNLKSGTECDIILSRGIYTKGDLAREYMLDLSGEEFVNNFYLTSLDACVQSDGGLYYLPGPANMYGIIYDKTVMEENGWKVPSNYSEFVSLLHTIDNSGLTVTEELDGEKKEVPVRAFRPSLKFTDSFRSLFYPFAYEAVFAGKENLEWLTAYQQGEGSMTGHMEPFADTLKKLLDDGVIRLDDWDYMPRYRLPMLCSSHSAVMICGPLNTFANESVINSDHEYAILPFFTGDNEGSDYLYALPAYFMGINKSSAEESDERRQLLLDIMEFICSPEAQTKLYGEANVLVSNIKGVAPGENSFNEGIQKTISEGRIITDFYIYAEAQLNDTARDMLTGSITVDKWLKDGDAARDKWLDGTLFTPPAVLGSCEEDLTRLETALLTGQIYRDMTGADIALVYVNKGDQGVNCRMFAGDVTATTANNIDPCRTSAEGEGLASGTLTGQQIIDCLNGMSTRLGHSDRWYFVASGLNVEFAPWMPAGERLVSCRLPDGTELDPDGTYHTAFISDKLFRISEDGISAFCPEDMQIMEGKWIDIFSQWLNEHGGVVTRPEQTTVLNWKTNT